MGLAVREFATAEEFLEDGFESFSGCLVTEASLPGQGGLALIGFLQEQGALLPVIVVAEHCDISLAMAAMKRGAIDFIEKPLRPDALQPAIASALAISQRWRVIAETRANTAERLLQLSSEEIQIMELLLAGELNKAIAHRLDLSPRTVIFRRASILRKMGATSLVELALLLAKNDELPLPGAMPPIAASGKRSSVLGVS
jgi:two-component system response regulator FixJ